MTKNLRNILANFVYREDGKNSKTRIVKVTIDGQTIPKYTNEFWTAKQRQAHSLHEVSYRACFKPQLPRFFIERCTNIGDIVYDPFSGRGTTILEAALCGRKVIANDVNPLSTILSWPRLYPPSLEAIEDRLLSIPLRPNERPEIPLSMFFHKKTLVEILSLKKYLAARKRSGKEDHVDRWIRMVATNRLTGHSSGFFSVYTLPPNQAMSRESQIKVNKERNQKPEYRDTKTIILKKSAVLMRDISKEEKLLLQRSGKTGKFLIGDARMTKKIRGSSVQLVVTSPPFLDVVQYAQDNWLRCWFNGIDAVMIGSRITMSRSVEDWCQVMGDVFAELYRVVRKNGVIAFEVGEVRNGKVRLEEFVMQLGIVAGFRCEAVMINRQLFTKTANIWGVSNNAMGTNSNRIVVFRKK